MPIELHGADIEVPLVSGERCRYVNLDIAASAPASAAVMNAVIEFMPWYSSVHRGAGYKSMVATEAYESARADVGRYFGAGDDQVVLFTRNTTDAMNLLASCLPDDVEVVAFETEHHANLLPWKRHGATLLPAPHSAADAVAALDAHLATSPGAWLVAVTGASNVTGELWPIEALTEVAHRHGARVVVDAAQLAPHRRVDMQAIGVDYLAASGHKMYAPFGAGVLVGRSDWLDEAEPFLAGGGAVRFVDTNETMWADLPDRQEAGSPNVVGAVAMAAACRELEQADVDTLAAEEHHLAERLLSGLAAIPGVEIYSLWGPDSDRIGVATFNLEGVPYATLAAALSAEYGIGVRHGCFCAHPLMFELLRVDRAEAIGMRDAMRHGGEVAVPGAVRASLGFGSTADDVERFLAAVGTIASDGLGWNYVTTDGGKNAQPDPDPRT